MANKKTTKKEAGKIAQSKGSWVNTSEKAVYVKIAPEDLKASKQSYNDETTHVFVMSKELLKKLVDGEGKPIKLGVFN